MTRTEFSAWCKTVHLLDGATGSMLRRAGMPAGVCSETWILDHPQTLIALQRAYLAAGSEIIYAPTFGANRVLLGHHDLQREVRALNRDLVQLGREAVGTSALLAGDMTTTGRPVTPGDDSAYETLLEIYCEQAEALLEAGVDLFAVETMMGVTECMAAIEAIRSLCETPILCTLSVYSDGKCYFDGSAEEAAELLPGLGADAVGINCSLGPKEILPFAQRLCRSVPAGVPVFVKPNAGLPNPDGSYNLDPDEFAAEMKEYAAIGVSMVGGCCGTTPAFIARLHETFSPLTPADKIPIRRSCLCTPVRFVEVDGITVVGERINPTGKKRLQQALRDGDSAYPCTQAVAQAEAGAQVLDVNAGLPGIDEAATLEQLVKDLQAVTDLPLQLDSSNPEALSRALRIYNGKPIVNSVNGEPETLEKILPLCKKYGAAVVGLALDKGGIPPTAEGRFAIAQRIVAAANAAGIPNEDIYIDCLTLTASAQQEGAVQTLEALSRCKRELGVRTVLGVSNISFGLPCRGYLNTTFLTMAMSAGLDLAIMNPNTPEMMAAVRAYRVLTSQDLQSTDYVAAYADVQIQTTQTSKSAATVAEVGAAAPGGDALFEAVRRGLKAEARAAADAALTMRDPLDVVNVSLIPALDAVGDGFEKGTVFLPQLLQAATAAQAAFEAIKAKIAASGQAQGSKGKIVIATVKGDVHDIGKNIVRVILENYGYDVLDLGRDVDPERVVEAVRQTGAKLVGLSALMTTTVPNMQATIEALHAAHLDCKVMVGGAVLTPDYARDIGADYYCKDAKASADLAKQLLG